MELHEEVDIVIVGAGLAGLTTALALHRYYCTSISFELQSFVQLYLKTVSTCSLQLIAKVICTILLDIIISGSILFSNGCSRLAYFLACKFIYKI